MRCIRILAAIALSTLLAAPAAPRAQKTDDSAEKAAQEIPKIDAGVGPCIADFQVDDAVGKPVYAAKIHTRIRYRAFGLGKSEVTVLTNYYGKASVTGLPEALKKPVRFDVSKGDFYVTVNFDPGKDCHPKYNVVLK